MMVGNPYLDPGCQAFFVCEDGVTNNCYGTCVIPGSTYYWTCPPGFFGDATREPGCQLYAAKNSNFTSIIFRLGAALGIGILVLVICMYKLIQKRKVKKHIEKFFKRNGGLLLQQQTSTGENTVERTRLFSGTELEKATDQYSRNRILGKGGQGVTRYRWQISGGKEVHGGG
nr:wall-associated receptor kinase 5-like [Tanacetum cinerariifolium]GEW30631.1 wall-associated receptor kinase 5-like [Tanacetum cinerariifolium]